MIKTLLTILLIFLIIGCQNQKIQNSKPIIEKTQVSNSTPKQLINSINECQQNIECKAKFNVLFESWLTDNNYISENETVATDEEIVTKLPKIVTNENQLTPSKILLSSNFMNNELVKGALNEWLTWKRPQLINTWQYYQFLKKDMLPVFQQKNIEEPFVLAIMAQESGGKVHSSSRAGAGGLFQLMPATAKRLGVSGKKGDYDLRFDPKVSAQAAALYIEEQLKLYDGDKAKVLAAYNSGENRFARLNRFYKNKPLWDKNFYYELPRETRHYVPVVLAAMLIFQDPEKFNVKLESVNADTMVVRRSEKISLSELAVCLGQDYRSEGWFRVLRNLNSGIKANKNIDADKDIFIPKILEETYQRNCQDSQLMQMAQAFHNADFKANQGLFKYRVKSGDSLGKIARKFRCTSKKEIARLNNLKAPRYLIRAGKHLKIPQC